MAQAVAVVVFFFFICFGVNLSATSKELEKVYLTCNVDSLAGRASVYGIKIDDDFGNLRKRLKDDWEIKELWSSGPSKEYTLQDTHGRRLLITLKRCRSGQAVSGIDCFPLDHASQLEVNGVRAYCYGDSVKAFALKFAQGKSWIEAGGSHHFLVGPDEVIVSVGNRNEITSFGIKHH